MISKNKNIAKTIAPLGDAEAFQDLYQHTHLIVYRYIFGLRGGPTEEVEDLTAETFIRAWKARRRFRGNQDAAVGWLLRIARNLVIDSFRRHQKYGHPLHIDQNMLASRHATPEDKALQKERVNKLWLTLGKLTTQQREIIILRYLLGWQVKAIARYLEMKENTVSVNIRRALQRIRRAWSETED